MRMLKNISMIFLLLLTFSLIGMNSFSEKSETDESIVKLLVRLADTNILITADPFFLAQPYLNPLAEEIITLMQTTGLYIEEKMHFDNYVACHILTHDLVAEAVSRLIEGPRSSVIAYALAVFTLKILNLTAKTQIDKIAQFKPSVREQLNILRQLLLHIQEQKDFTQEIIKPFLTDAILLEALLMLGDIPKFTCGIEVAKKILAAYATTTSNTRVLAILISKNINLQIRETTTRDTLLHLAARFANKETIALLLDNSVKLEERNNAGFTALHEAIIHQNYEAVETLLTYGADATACTAENKNALELAQTLNNARIKSLLSTKTLKPLNITTNNDESLLSSSNTTGHKSSYINSVSLFLQDEDFENSEFYW